MKKVGELMKAVGQRDGGALASMATPHVPVRQAPSKEAVDFFNGIFQQLRVIFPAMQAHIKTQAELDELRVQWIAAFREAGVTKQAMVDAGLRRARQSASPYLPSPGQFIAWCNEEVAASVGLPDIDTVMHEFRKYCADKSLYASPEAFPWSCHAMYWLCTEMRSAMIERSLSTIELTRFAEKKLKEWAKKIQAGEEIPAPVIQIENHTRPPSTIEQLGLGNEKTNQAGAEMLARIRARNGNKTEG